MTISDYTAMRTRELLAEHDAHDDRADDQDDRDRAIREAQARYPAARVYWDGEVDDVVVDLSSSRWC